ncbi:caspase domain-containing protein [Biscogniauxia sp. FL1348]|nr:caspase domain-containing protein [Biscogniauxia sp. FL1348]
MPNTKSKPKRWAVLVGVNFYGKKHKPLRGCVSDVLAMESYFLGTGMPAEQITILKASQPSHPESDTPAEEPDSWPTYDNVTCSLKAVTQKASEGDLVYIHFSGHGTQSEEKHPELPRPGVGRLSLVLFDSLTGYRYFHSVTLTLLLKDMVAKGLLVTVILDCCFSGDVARKGGDENPYIRYVKYDPAIDAAHPLAEDDDDDDDTPGSQLLWDGPRNAREVPVLLIKSDLHVILCACAPHEVAEELRIPPQGPHYAGALSHFLLRTLKALRGTQISLPMLYDHLRLKFRAFWPQQTPIWYGSAARFFFNDMPATQTVTGFITGLSKPRDSHIYLDSGTAQGVVKGDEYAVYPLAAADSDAPSFCGQVETAGPLQSVLVPIGPLPDSTRGETRWKARPLSLPAWRALVKLPFDLNSVVKTESTPRKPPILRERSFMQVVETDSTQTCAFNVHLTDGHQYQILNGAGNPIPYTPLIPRDRPTAEADVLDVVEHLARFKYVEGIYNQDVQPSFEQTFTVYLEDQLGNRLPTGKVAEVKHGDSITVAVKNFGANPLYLNILDMGPLWQVDDVLSEEGGAEFKVVKPQVSNNPGTQDVALEMSIPKELHDQGVQECEDTLKIFITSVPTSFQSLSLPELSNIEEARHDKERGSKRYHELSDLLTHLTTPTRKHTPGAPDENWATRTFTVRTVK